MAPRSKRGLASALGGSTKRTRRQIAPPRSQDKPEAKLDNSTFFKAVWRELRADGWYHKQPPRSVSDSFYRFIRPGASLKGQEGVDFFVGEQAIADTAEGNVYIRSISIVCFKYLTLSGDNALAIDDSIDELREAPVSYCPQRLLPTSLAEVEAIK
eukprot:jgi/Phyca11/118683/e_gw1.36.498.1